MPTNDSNRILIVAAEASSCLYAQRLLQHWKAEGFLVEAFGVGDAAMAAEGFECLARAEDLSVVGLAEVFAHWSEIKAAFNLLLAQAKERRPRAVLLLDYPGFNLRFAKKMKALGIPVVYYISPQVWAWKTSRVKTIRRVVDKMLVVFPFEKEFYAGFNMEVDFVGHPLLDELNPAHFDKRARSLHRQKYGIQDEEMVLALMPGSRRSELKNHMLVQLEAARKLLEQYPRLKVILLVSPNFSQEEIQGWLDSLDFPLILIKDEPFSMIDLADVVLCASGTATLMVGLLEKPMVVMYRMNPITAYFARKFVTRTKFFGLINLVLDKAVVPELFQEQASADHLVLEVGALLGSESARLQMASELKPAKDRLGLRGATVRVANALKEYWRV